MGPNLSRRLRRQSAVRAASAGTTRVPAFSARLTGHAPLAFGIALAPEDEGHVLRGTVPLGFPLVLAAAQRIPNLRDETPAATPRRDRRESAVGPGGRHIV